MFKKGFVATALLLFQVSSPAHAADYSSNKSSMVSAGERYEIVQSELAAKWTFRIDHFCGNIMQLVKTTGDASTWQIIPIQALPKCLFDGRSHYQLFTSGLAARHTFLMNTTTGVTWQLVTDKNDNHSWELFEK